MALVRPQGSLSWTASDSSDVVSYVLYQGVDGNAPDYTSPNVNVGNVLTVTLPVDGLPSVEGSVIFAVAAVDSAGNQSDLALAEAILIDVTPPAAPGTPVYAPGF